MSEGAGALFVSSLPAHRLDFNLLEDLEALELVQAGAADDTDDWFVLRHVDTEGRQGRQVWSHSNINLKMVILSCAQSRPKSSRGCNSTRSRIPNEHGTCLKFTEERHVRSVFRSDFGSSYRSTSTLWLCSDRLHARPPVRTHVGNVPGECAGCRRMLGQGHSMIPRLTGLTNEE